jgi:hypothetical protein
MSNASFNWHAKTPPPRTQPIIPVAGSHTPDLSGLLGSLHITQHVLEMFHGTLPAGPQNRLLDRLANRLTEIVSEAQKLDPSWKGNSVQFACALPVIKSDTVFSNSRR